MWYDANALGARHLTYRAQTLYGHGGRQQMSSRTIDSCVVGIHHNSGVRNGKRLDVDCCIVFELRSGRITSGREYFYNLHAWEEFWS